jgi:membrane protease YdiL (CAAX protease family)
VGTCIGLFAVGAISSLVLRLPTQTMITDAGLLRTLLLEALLAAAWIPVLRRRGWSLGCVSVRLEVMDLARGVGVLVLSYLAYWLAFTLAMLAFPMFPDFARGMQFGGAPSWWAVVIVSLVNPVAEEFLYLGFITNLVRADGLQVALLAGIVARAAVHVYQGPVGLVSAIAIGLVFGIYYLRSDRLWPVVVAHGLSDFIALGRLANSAA